MLLVMKRTKNLKNYEIFRFKVDNITEFSDKKLKPFTSIDYIFDFSSSSDTSLKYVSSPEILYSVDVQNQSDHYINFKLGFDLTSLEGLNISSSYERNQGNEGTKVIPFQLVEVLNQNLILNMHLL